MKKILLIFITIISILALFVAILKLTSGEVKAATYCRPYDGLYDVALESKIAQELRAYRQARRLYTLYWTPTRDRLANSRLKDFSDYNLISHNQSYSTLSQCGLRTSGAGEAIAIGMTDAKQIMQAWHNSPTHRAVLNLSWGRSFAVSCAIYNRNIPVINGSIGNRACVLVVGNY